MPDIGDRRPDFPPRVFTFEDAGNRLDSWKEIGAYLGRSEKTVRRWEETEGLPVYRLHHEKRSSVYAYRSELEAWRQTRKLAAASVVEVITGLAECDGSKETTSDPDAGIKAPGRRQRLKWIAWSAPFIFLIVFLLGWSRWRRLVATADTPVRIESVAVLPFENLSHDPGQEFLADGMTEELITELSRTSSLRVISRMSVMHYKNTVKPLAEVTRELGVDALVRGTMARSGSHIRLTIHLMTPLPERDLWTDVYNGELGNALEFQRDVAHDLGSKLKAKLNAKTNRESRPESALDAQTYENYLRARYFLAKRTSESMSQAAVYFKMSCIGTPSMRQHMPGLRSPTIC